MISNATHLVQSLYAQDFLKKHGIESCYLCDYLNSYFLQSNKVLDLENKQNIVVYNPKKGYHFTKEIIKRARHFTWVPLKGMRREEASLLLQKAKVYIDFGDHPGKNRIPREAAISKCYVITGRKGSAAYNDVNIPDKYKIDDKKQNINKIIDLIEDCYTHFDSHLSDFAHYRSVIEHEEEKFLEDINKLFVLKK